MCIISYSCEYTSSRPKSQKIGIIKSLKFDLGEVQEKIISSAHSTLVQGKRVIKFGFRCEYGDQLVLGRALVKGM